MNRRKNLDRQRKKRQSIILLLMLAAIIFAILGRFIFARDKEINPEDLELNTKATKEQTATSTSSAKVFPVHIAGAVRKPGVYYFSEGVIVGEAIERAGGATLDGAVDVLNMASLLHPHAKLYVPTLEEVEAADPGTSFEGIENDPASAESGKINLNLATEAELLTIPGIGPATASAILSYREENGKFSQIEDLMNVTGIKEKKFANLEPYLYVP